MAYLNDKHLVESFKADCINRANDCERGPNLKDGLFMVPTPAWLAMVFNNKLGRFQLEQPYTIENSNQSGRNCNEKR